MHALNLRLRKSDSNKSSCFPNKNHSYLLSLASILLPFFNPLLSSSIGLLYWVIGWQFRLVAGQYDTSIANTTTNGLALSLDTLLRVAAIYALYATVVSGGLSVLLPVLAHLFQTDLFRSPWLKNPWLFDALHVGRI